LHSKAELTKELTGGSVVVWTDESHAPPLDAVLLGLLVFVGGAASVSGGAAAHGVPGGGEQSCYCCTVAVSIAN
jgi:hypothetical protein